MSSPGPLFRPFDRLVKINIKGKELEIPENNMLLRGFQYLAPENVAHGRFCWNEECQYCRVTYDLGEGTPSRVALSCKLMVKEGMRLTELASEIIYCLRGLGVEQRKQRRQEGK
jgi:NADH dehydrogenase/NADH:ubiquinone oxidoreductase subunit G